jgi:hypothetical protein
MSLNVGVWKSAPALAGGDHRTVRPVNVRGVDAQRVRSRKSQDGNNQKKRGGRGRRTELHRGGPFRHERKSPDLRKIGARHDEQRRPDTFPRRSWYCCVLAGLLALPSSAPFPRRYRSGCYGPGHDPQSRNGITVAGQLPTLPQEDGITEFPFHPVSCNETGHQNWGLKERELQIQRTKP